MKTLKLHILLLITLLTSASVTGQYFSDMSNDFNMDTKIPNVYNWCPGPGVYYLPGQEIYLDYSIYENNLTSVELGFSSEEGGEIQILGPLPAEGPAYITVPDVPTTFAKFYIVAKDSYGHVNNYPVPYEGYFTVGPATQSFDIPAGWSGISTAYVPVNTDVSAMYSSNMSDIVVIQDMENVFWPGGGVFTLNEWDVFQGYCIKALNPFTIEIQGSSVQCGEYGWVPEGWGLIPIVAECDLDAENFFWWNLWSSVIIKEACGWRVFWPDYNVKTLEILERGKSYYVYSIMANNDFVFQPCWEGESGLAYEKVNTPEPWNEPVSNPSSHIIAIPEDVIASSDLKVGMTIGAFNSQGLCVGLSSLNSFHITVFGDDPATETIDGMIPGKTIYFKVWDQENQKEMELIPEFDPALTQSDGTFVPEGLSAISSLKLVPLGMGDVSTNPISLHPNPATTSVKIITGSNEGFNLQLTDAKGSVIFETSITGQCTVDLNSFARGLYFVKVFNVDTFSIKKLMVE